ncbi:hypothetical protein V5O48_016552 [Marasmius crinis-equi]|uniref:Uncharacterized protein n=1 Tax=Marasmius crinis-equi TaxID=585013 RepID=A0ABR3ERE5_9AGAR
MIAGISRQLYEEIKEDTKGWGESMMWMRMADGALVPGIASWNGTVRVKGLEVESSLEVFDSGGQWEVLFGKPLLEKFKAVHDFEKEELVVRKGKELRRIFNEGLGKKIEPKPMVATIEEVQDKEKDVKPTSKEKAGDLGRGTEYSEAPRDREVLDESLRGEDEIPTHNTLQNEDTTIHWPEQKRLGQ